MKDAVIVFLLIHLIFIMSMTMTVRLGFGFGYVFAIVVLLFVNTLLHLYYCVSGRVPSYVLPLSWATCTVTVVVYYYLFMQNTYLGRNFDIAVYIFFFLVPVFVISALTAGVYCLMRWWH